MPASEDTVQASAAERVVMSDLVLVDQNEAQGWRVRQDERLDHLFEERCDWIREYGRAGQLAVDSGDGPEDMRLTYPELDGKANQLARYLRLRGVRGGDRVALLFDRAAPSYIAMLAVLKIGATYVPLDTGLPTGRLTYIVEDAQVHTVLSMSHVADLVEQIDLLTASGAELVYVDHAAPLIEDMDTRRLIDAERGDLGRTEGGRAEGGRAEAGNQLAYISYASVNGRPEGVAIDHASICNFVKVAAEVYGIRPRDRFYQGLPISLDFSVEEIWVPWVCGATLVPKPAGPALFGAELHDFLTRRRVTGMVCVPGVLATLDSPALRDLPDLRFLLMCGKDASPELIGRWLRPGRRFLNVWGPTEATVTTTWTELQPGKPITIGIPLPTYTTVILDRDDPYRALPHGEIGEIGVAGIGLACGYLNHDDLTGDVFIQDFLGIPANPSGRIYRTGDLGRVNEDLEIEYHGPLNAEAERSYRIELTEVQPVAAAPEAEPVPLSIPVPEAAPTGAPTAPSNPAELAFAGVLAEVAGVEQVSIDSNFFNDLGADSLMMAQFCARVRKRSDLPSVSMKDIYRFPTIRSLTAALSDDESTPMERSLAEVLAALVGVQVPVDSDFFDDLGADSLMMAQFCARVRKRVDLPSVSMKDVYAAPTIRGLATLLAGGDASTGLPTVPGAAPSRPQTRPAAPVDPVVPASTASYWFCGLLQLLIFAAATYGGAVLLDVGFGWVSDGVGMLDTARRSVVFALGGFVGACTLPILAKWILVGDWKTQQIRVWSLGYVRFWLVKILVRTNPLAFFVGSPLYTLYLRLLGAKIGRGVVILSPTVPVCTDLLTIGEGTVINKDCVFNCYRASGGWIQTGTVTLGRDVFVGEATVLDVQTWMGDGAQLGHTSSLHAGQFVPAGQIWHGSPAQSTTVNYRAVEPAPCGILRRVGFPVLQLFNVMVLTPLGLVAVMTLAKVPRITALLNDPLAPSTWAFYRDIIALAYVAYFGAVVGGILLALTLPRLLNVLIRPDKVYALYGMRYWAQRVITRMTNVASLNTLFGDSSYVVGFLSLLGYKLTPVEQTGSNFGARVKHDNPYLCSAGTGTVVADGLAFINADYSSTSFKVSRVSVGARSFLGNNIHYPAQGRVGDNCLLGTKVMVPIDGPVRENVGLLGSPSFEIPRTVDRDAGQELPPEEVRRRLRGKNRHNLVTMALYLLVRWIYFTIVFIAGAIAVQFEHRWGAVATAVVGLAYVFFRVAYWIPVDRACTPLQTLAPDGCSIYDRGFFRHERFWKVPAVNYIQFFNGTPFKNVIWRLQGVRIGRRVFDDGASIVERTYTAIGDDCTLNEKSIIQCHSQEDGAFKSDRIVIGSGVTLGVGAFVHYGVTIGDGSVLEADSFLMKGEEIPPHQRWGGNPATDDIRYEVVQPVAQPAAVWGTVAPLTAA
ncbi:MAG TPA: Pls/PosA family non-ribosomal peptide synthetase [Pseudonocardia sp.]|nr:Pls/PosA family non-ribosomal peptide synthetase [Pseudonocardia sp.]